MRCLGKCVAFLLCKVFSCFLFSFSVFFIFMTISPFPCGQQDFLAAIFSNFLTLIVKKLKGKSKEKQKRTLARH